jgi:hypothetical protein
MTDSLDVGMTANPALFRRMPNWLRAANWNPFPEPMLKKVQKFKLRHHPFGGIHNSKHNPWEGGVNP